MGLSHPGAPFSHEMGLFGLPFQNPCPPAHSPGWRASLPSRLLCCSSSLESSVSPGKSTGKKRLRMKREKLHARNWGKKMWKKRKNVRSEVKEYEDRSRSQGDTALQARSPGTGRQETGGSKGLGTVASCDPPRPRSLLPLCRVPATPLPTGLSC